MDKDFKDNLERLEVYDIKVSPKYWLGNNRTPHTMSFPEWRDFVISGYDVISDHYAKKVYESIVTDPDSGEQTLVQLSLRDAMNKVEGTGYEDAFRRAIMRCIHSGRKLDVELRPVMDAYYGVGEEDAFSS